MAEVLGNLIGTLISIGLAIWSIRYCSKLGKRKGIPGAWAYGALFGPLGVLWCLAKEDKSKGPQKTPRELMLEKAKKGGS
jgi:hypothetical protein